MNPLHRRSQCKKCRMVFVRDQNEQVYCNPCLIGETYNKMFPESKNGHKITCQGCGQVFEAQYKGRKFCSQFCRKLPNPTDELTDEERFEMEAQRWVNKKENKGNPNFPGWDELNRRAEYKRLFGKNAFNHYLKGRKWDFI